MPVFQLPCIKEKLITDGVSSEMKISDESLRKRRDFIKSLGLDPKNFTNVVFSKDEIFSHLQHH